MKKKQKPANTFDAKAYGVCMVSGHPQAAGTHDVIIVGESVSDPVALVTISGMTGNKRRKKAFAVRRSDDRYTFADLQKCVQQQQ